MKKLTTIILFSLLIAACNNTPEDKTEKTKPTASTDLIYTDDLITVEHDSHELILWLNGYGSQMIHKPNCKFCQKDTLWK